MSTTLRLALLVSLGTALGTFARPAAAQERPSARVGAAGPDLRIDGFMTEAEWEEATPVGTLSMIEPLEGVPPTGTTEVRVLADSRTLYIGIWAHYADPGSVVTYSKARDSQLSSEDHVKIILDPFLDGQSGYVFAINPGGARYDALVSGQGSGENSTWDAAWEAATQRTEDGWTAEIRIPVQSLTFDAGLDAWGLQRRTPHPGPDRGEPLGQSEARRSHRPDEPGRTDHGAPAL